MMYWDYPRVGPKDRLAHLPALDTSGVRLSLAEAYVRLAVKRPPDQMTLSMHDGLPAYRFHIGRGQTLVYADDGSTITSFSAEEARKKPRSCRAACSPYSGWITRRSFILENLCLQAAGRNRFSEPPCVSNEFANYRLILLQMKDCRQMPQQRSAFLSVGQFACVELSGRQADFSFRQRAPDNGDHL